jgi:hypothetical protein
MARVFVLDSSGASRLLCSLKSGQQRAATLAPIAGSFHSPWVFRGSMMAPNGRHKLAAISIADQR